MSLIPGGFLPSKNVYYIVYDNGDYEETEEFQLSEIETYYLYSLTDSYQKNNDVDIADFPSCTDKILGFADSIENSYVHNLYICNNRYFFDIYDERRIHKKYASTIYEYFPSDGTFKKIVQFKDYDTRHVELY